MAIRLPSRSLLLPCRRVSQQIRHSSTIETPETILNSGNVDAPYYGHIKVLSFNRPTARNALSRALVDRLGQEVAALQKEPEARKTRALILASEVDSSFCAGADLKERRTFSTEQTEGFLTDLRRTFANIAGLRIPTISAVSSTALGGGLELALCTHFRVFGSTAIVGLPETRLAIIPGAGGTYRLPGVVGLNRARDLILTGRRVGGPESYFIGLCDRLVEILPEEAQQPGKARLKVLEEAIKLAQDICEGGPIATTQALQAVTNWEMGASAEDEAYRGVLLTDDRVEALDAFREKRKPDFRGQ